MTDERLLLQCARFRVAQIDVTGHDGRIHQYDAIRHPGAVVLLPLLDDGSVVMIENHRHVVGETLLELPAGTIDPNESPQRCAARELAEETGYRAEQLEKLHEFYSCPGICDELMHLYLARGLSSGNPAREATEMIENRIVTRPQVVEMLAQGRIRDAKTLIGLYALLVASPTRR